MKLTIMLGMPLIGGLIEWSLVILINVSLILFCTFSGLYATIQPLVDHGQGGIAVGLVAGLAAYSLAYVAVCKNPSGCGKPYVENLPLWMVRVANILYQIVHALFFIGLMLVHREIAINFAFWLYCLMVISIVTVYWCGVACWKIKIVALEEYNFYKSLETVEKEEVERVTDV